MNTLLEQNFKKQNFLAPSDYMWNNAVNDWALSWDLADIMVESQSKEFSLPKFA